MVLYSASYLTRVIVVLSFSLMCVETTPQIFTTVYTHCEFLLNGKKLIFSNKIWTLETKEYILYYSLCKSDSIQEKCLKNTSSCLRFKKNEETIYFGSEFIAADDSDDFVLRSSSSHRCASNPSKNYTLSVFLHCSDSISVNPRFRYSDDEDECAFEVTMMTPNCQPKCTEIVQNSYLLDIRKFPRNIRVISGTREFSLSLCGGNKDCGGNIGACEILSDGSTIPLATIESQHINYDVSKNQLSARGRYKDSGNRRNVRDINILIKCNWESIIGNATYKKVGQQGRHYRFEIESSYGCVKIPRQCTFRNNVDNLNYNLEKLYVKEGWTVTGVPVGKILVNICGPLEKVESICAAQSSQVCYVDNKNYFNRGSILTTLKEYDDIVTVVFESGSTCNGSLSYSTEIHLRCSEIEKGPVFEKYSRCVTYLVWETPQACPVDFYGSSNCYVNDRVSNRDLRKLYTETDRVYPLSSNNNTKLIYNLCGPIHVTCNNFTNVSFCVKTEQKETVIGWETKDLVSDKGNLRMELSGDQCSRNKTGGVIINFVCTYDNPSLETQINVVEDNCKYNVTIFTSSACRASNIFNDCIYNSHNLTYNLSSLVLKNENYVIESDEHVEYIFNLCGPIISGPEAQCGGNTMVCLYNKTEVNIKYRYTSLGGIGKPHIRNNTLVIEADMGSYCTELGHYKSIIQFECSNQKFLPTFLGKESCIYKFLWKTPEVCSKEKKCIINGTKNDMQLDLNDLTGKSIKFNVDNKTNQYEFNLCQDIYVKYQNGVNNTDNLKRTFFISNRIPYLVLYIQKNCNAGGISKVIFKILCSEKLNAYFEPTSYENCILNVTLHTRMICSQKNLYFLNDTEKVDKHPHKMEIIPIKPEQSNLNCTIVSEESGHEFIMNKIKSTELYLRNTTYILNFNEVFRNCTSFFCKNHLPVIQKMCPVVISFNHNIHLVRLQYYSSNKCDLNDFFNLEVLLKCDETETNARIIKTDVCNSQIMFSIPEVCKLFAREVRDAKSTTAIIVTVVIVLTIVVVLAYLTRRRWYHRLRYDIIRIDKTRVPVYNKNCHE